MFVVIYLVIAIISMLFGWFSRKLNFS